MVRCILLSILIFTMTWPGMLMAQMVLSVQADKSALVFGEALNVEIHVQAAASPIAAINLEPLKKDFEIYAVSSRSQTEMINMHEVVTEIMLLTLYPLRAGHLQLPVLEFLGKKSKPLSVQVADSGPQTPQVGIKVFFDSTHHRVRQANTLYMEITDDGSLQWLPPKDILASGMHVRQLAETQRDEMIDGSSVTVHRYAWSVMPLREGVATVRFPMLSAVKFGINLRYAIPPVKLDVAPVLFYLPVFVPIGKILVSIKALPEKILLNRPENWEMTIQGAGLSEEGIAQLLSALHGSDALQLYPFLIRIEKQERAISPLQTWMVEIPFKPLRAGKIRLPDIDIPYFDPASGLLTSFHYEGQTLEVLNPLRSHLLKAGTVLLLLILVASAGAMLWKQLRRNGERNASLLRIKVAATYQDLNKALQAFNWGDGTMESATLQNWLELMEESFGVNTRLRELVQILEIACYGSDKAEKSLSELANELWLELNRLRSNRGKVKVDNEQKLTARLINPNMNP